MNQYDLKLFRQYRIRPTVYPLLQAISATPGLSNDRLAAEIGITSQRAGRVVKDLEASGVIEDTSEHPGRRAWNLTDEEIIVLIRKANTVRRGGAV